MAMVCLCYSSGHYVGEIDLADIQVIYNPSLLLPPATSQSLNNSISYYRSDCCTVIENTNTTSTNARPLANTNGEDDRSVKLSNVLVENGRIILQYQNKDTSFRASTTPRHSDHVAAAAPKRTKHKLQYDQDDGQLQYDMNDLVWKNAHAKY